ncbi:MAG: phosphotransferase [Phenylobacterium sp.]
MGDTAALFTTPAPQLGRRAAEALVRDRFRIAGMARRLTSERDLNFRITTDDGRDYVLKVANAAEARDVLDFQARALAHVSAADPDLPVPRVVRTPEGAEVVEAEGSLVRLLTWLDGTMLHAVERTPALRGSLGVIHARLGLALKGFSHPAADHVLLWDLKGASGLRSLLRHVRDAEPRALAERALARFEARAAALPNLRTQVIHNDLNFHNVVVATGDPEQVAGILDFGDMVRSPLVCDVAVAAAYHVRADERPLADAAEYLAAYHAVSPLRDEELEVLGDLIATRLAMSVLISGWRAAEHPQNRDYILRNEPAARAGLQAFQRLSADEATGILRRACGGRP